MNEIYLCAVCQNKIEVDEKDGIVIVYGCSTCREKLVHKINDMIGATSVRLSAVATEGCKISVEEKIIRHNLNAVDMLCKVMNRER